MKRPPNRKALVATVVLLVAAAVVAFARPAVGVPPSGSGGIFASTTSLFKQSLEPGGL